jgi:hypothetical protein
MSPPVRLLTPERLDRLENLEIARFQVETIEQLVEIARWAGKAYAWLQNPNQHSWCYEQRSGKPRCRCGLKTLLAKITPTEPTEGRHE